MSKEIVPGDLVVFISYDEVLNICLDIGKVRDIKDNYCHIAGGPYIKIENVGKAPSCFKDRDIGSKYSLPEFLRIINNSSANHVCLENCSFNG